MYVVDVGIPWTKAPLLYATPGYITSQEEIQRIANQGYRMIYHDTDRFRPMVGGALDRLTTPDSVWGHRVPLEEELHRAHDVYTASLEHVKQFMHSATNAPLDVTATQPLVESIISSLDRNLDALIFLAKLRLSDEYTFGHSVNVSIFATAYARFRGLDAHDLYAVGMAGLLHDYGKALVPAARAFHS